MTWFAFALQKCKKKEGFEDVILVYTMFPQLLIAFFEIIVSQNVAFYIYFVYMIKLPTFSDTESKNCDK
jgi:hypothetical protein